MTRARELANFADNTAGLETLTVSDVTDLSVSASNINSATNQITDSSTDLNIDSNTLVVDKSENRVGIRTPNPDVTLDIHDADPAIDLYDTGTNGFCRIDANGANLTLHADKGANSSSSTIKFGVDNSVKMTIDSSGNVGIGTTPASGKKLHVNGDTQIDGNLALIGNDKTISSNNSGAGYIKIFGGGTNEGGAIEFRGGGNSGDLRFFTGTSGAGTERMRVDSSGNVGIGINNPDKLLHVRSADGVTGVIEIEGGKSSVTSVGEVNSKLDFGSRDTSATGGIGGSIQSITEYSNGAYVGMGFFTAQQGRSPVLQEAMRITAGGDVNITTGVLQGGIGAYSTGGTQNWNDSSNAISGSGRTLLLGTHSNGPGGNNYFHPFTFEYNDRDGTGNMTQTAWGYKTNNRYMRWRYVGTWSSWYSF